MLLYYYIYLLSILWYLRNDIKVVSSDFCWEGVNVNFHINIRVSCSW